MWWAGFVRKLPVAQTLVLRRVLTGGISTNRCLVARTGLLVRMLFLSSGRAVFWNAAGVFRWVVFGTLLGPEATGPGGWHCSFGCGVSVRCLFVSGFLAAPVMHVWFPFLGGWCVGGWYGVVV